MYRMAEKEGCLDDRLLRGLLDGISEMGDAELGELIQAVIHRYNVLHREDTAVFLTLPKNDPEMRRKVIERAAEMAEKYTDTK